VRHFKARDTQLKGVQVRSWHLSERERERGKIKHAPSRPSSFRLSGYRVHLLGFLGGRTLPAPW